ncbi:hypothetical protein [Magnetospirillum sp. UT-4]|uniref:hypothetical protein n=1 Tax=Magnetospirillum sp. UT-4 TaxID=2681467 RepID=UPI0013801144|nr:hypothetical protein [Magnetospirillum sp. UT-4]CAA7613513.1 conserved hypothetical protein [Magnetospirillum sp. UT-4]
MSTRNPAERIRALIEGALSSAASRGCSIDVNEIYVRALTRCGVCNDEARALLALPGDDPVTRILHFAGDSHNFAVLAVEEALAAA